MHDTHLNGCHTFASPPSVSTDIVETDVKFF